MSTREPNIRQFGTPTYAISPDDAVNLRISAVLNEVAHVFDMHKDGLWKSEYKDGFARLLVPDLKRHPKLIRAIIDLDDRVFSMVVYRAVEILKQEDDG
jgi:hypothetical protein